MGEIVPFVRPSRVDSPSKRTNATAPVLPMHTASSFLAYRERLFMRPEVQELARLLQKRKESHGRC